MSDANNKSLPSAGRTLAKMTGGAQIQAIVPTTLGEVFAMAEMVHSAGLSPNSVTSPQQLTIIFLKAMEIGMPPMSAMDCIGVINGKPCLYGDAIPSLLWSRGFKIKEWYEHENDLENIVAHCTITRPDGDEYSFRYSAQDARDNGLWDTRPKDSKGNPNKAPWYRFKKRMVRMRCRGWGARDCATDVLRGIPIYEEQADIELGRGEYREVRPAALEVPDDIADDATVAATATVSEAESSQDEPITNVQLYLQRLGEQLAGAGDEVLFIECWQAHEELVEAGRLPKEAVQAARVLYDEHGKRFA